MTKKELDTWYKWYRQYKNGYHMSDSDWHEFVRLNHIVLGSCHDVHNENMSR